MRVRVSTGHDYQRTGAVRLVLNEMDISPYVTHFSLTIDGTSMVKLAIVTLEAVVQDLDLDLPDVEVRRETEP